MRHDAAAPVLVVIDLLQRADTLAEAAAAAIAAGDHDLLTAVLDDRQEIITAAIETWKRVEATGASAAVTAQVAKAATSSVAAGNQARAVAQVARAEVLSALAALDARQQASQEYLSDAPRSLINVVL